MIPFRAMADVFVDLGYRGLSIGKRARLAEVRPSTGYIESNAPMPVGTTLTLATEDGIAIDTTVIEVREMASGDRAPGMHVRPIDLRAGDGAASAWWKAHVALPDLAKTTLVGVVATVVPKKRERDDAAPELVDDGRNTAVNELPVEAIAALEDDGKKTTMMSAVDLEALGLASSSGELPVVKDEEPKGKKKRKRRPSQSDA